MTTTRQQALYINQNGRVVCYQHAGAYLTAAINNRAFGLYAENEVTTPLDSWIMVRPHEQINDADFTWACEDCRFQGLEG